MHLFHLALFPRNSCSWPTNGSSLQGHLSCFLLKVFVHNVHGFQLDVVFNPTPLLFFCLPHEVSIAHYCTDQDLISQCQPMVCKNSNYRGWKQKDTHPHTGLGNICSVCDDDGCYMYFRTGKADGAIIQL